MLDKKIIGVDIGGTKILAGRVENETVTVTAQCNTPSEKNQQEVINEVIETIEKIFTEDIYGIGIGVPGLVDIREGLVYDVQNIPSWKRVPLKKELEKHFGVPVYVNNDANCYVVGEKYFGKAKHYENFVGVTLGTGLGAGIFINNQLHNGVNCGAGEFGSIPYLDSNFERYCSGQFFSLVKNINGELAFSKAENKDVAALQLFKEFGEHLGTFFQLVMYSLAPEAIVIGGSISKGFRFFSEAMFQKINEFPFEQVKNSMKIEVTETSQMPILGAASLCYNAELMFHY